MYLLSFFQIKSFRDWIPLLNLFELFACTLMLIFEAATYDFRKLLRKLLCENISYCI